MASSIVPGNIDGTFPVAGQDNSSQGFRDNFTASKNNFTNAKSEIEALQTYRASLNASNDFRRQYYIKSCIKRYSNDCVCTRYNRWGNCIEPRERTLPNYYK